MAPVRDAAQNGKDQVALQRPGHCTWCSSSLLPVQGSTLQSQLLHYLHQQQDTSLPMWDRGKVRQRHGLKRIALPSGSLASPAT